MRLHYKVTIGIIIAFLLIAAIYAGIHQSFQTRRIETVRGKIVLLLQTLVERDRAPLANEIFEKRLRAIELRLKQMKQVKGIEEIAVYDQAGKMLWSEGSKQQSDSLAPSILESCKTAPHTAVARIGQTPVLVYVQGIDAIRERLGYIRVHYSLGDIEAERKTSLILIAAQLLTLLLVLFLLLRVFLSRAVIAPLEALREGIRNVEAGQVGAQVPVTSSDELGEVSAAFNRMSTERLRADAALRESEERFKALHNASFGGIAIHDQGVILDCNKGLADMTGYEVAELVGMNGLSLIAERSREMVRDHVRSGYENPYEAFGVRKNGEEYPLRLEARNVPHKGKMARTVEFRDISDRKRAEEELRANEAKQRKMVANIGDVIVIIDKDGINRYKSPNIEKLFGWKPEDVVGASTWDNVHPDDLEATQAFIGEILTAPNKSGTAECRYRCKDGAYRLIEFTGVNLLHDPDINGILGNYHDITDRKLAEEALQAEKAFGDTVIESMPGLFYVFEEDSAHFVRRSGNWPEIIGYSEDELDSMTALDLVVDKELCASRMKEVFDKGYSSMENPLLTKSGKQIPYMFTGARLVSRGKAFLVGMGFDLSERENLEDQLRQSEKMRAVGQLAGGIAHDFNNQLAGVLGYADILIHRLKDTELSRYAQTIKTAALRSADLTKQLLAFSRKGKDLSIAVDLHEVMAEVISILQHSIDKRIEIETALDAPCPTVLGDPSQLQNAILNLTINARDAMPDGGRLRLETSTITLSHETMPSLPSELTPGQYIKVAVSDTGTGMTEETLQRIFEPFYTTKEQGKGTGMGLASVYGTVQNHQGDIAVRSKIGQGTTFDLYLPLHEEQSEKPEATEEALTHGSAHILLVDDNDLVRHLGADILESLGYEVSVCADGKEAVTHYQQAWEKIDLVIMDMVMPKMNGPQAFGEMKRINPNIRAILSSGHSLEGQAQNLLNKGALGFVPKPYKVSELATAVAGALRGRNQQKV
jgi:PAS domain S-box-containing protein